MSFSTRCPSVELLPCVMYEMVKRSLGNKSIKCIVDEDECIFTGDMEVLLSSLTIEHPVGELIYQALKSHKEQFGEGIRTLMFMITRIAKAVSQLEDLGIRSAASLSVIQEVINELAHQIQQICTSVRSLSNSERKDEFKSKQSFSQKDDFNKDNVFAIKPVTDVISGDSSEVTPIFFEKSSPHSLPHIFKDDQQGFSPSVRREDENSIIDQPLEFKSSDYNCSARTTSKENAKHQPSRERNCLTSDHPILQTQEPCDSVTHEHLILQSQEPCDSVTHEHLILQTQEPCDSVTHEHLVAGLVMESDPVLLKMSDLFPEDKYEDEDIDWYFDESFVKDEDEKKICQQSVQNVKSEIEKTTNNDLDSSNSNNSESSLSAEGNQQGDSLHEKTFKENIQFNERTHPNLADGNHHDSDFEDCFDDLENRKQVVVVVEKIEDCNSDSPILQLCADKSAIMKSRMAHNIHKHFAPVEFETISDVTSLNDCQSDEEFNDCFDDAIGCDSQGHSCPSALPKTHLYDSELQINQLGSGRKQEENVLSLKSDFEHSLSSSTSCKHISELDKLNSVLSSMNVRKSQNVKEILVSSRHKVEESYFNEFNDKVDIKTSDNSEERSYSNSKPDALEQNEILSLKALNEKAESNSSTAISMSNYETVCSPLQKYNAKQDTVDSITGSPSSPSRHISELEKLNSILSSINVKGFLPETRQILISSRHCLKEDELLENCPPIHIASKDATDLDEIDTKSELPTLCSFKNVNVRAVADQEQPEGSLQNSGQESLRHARCDWKSQPPHSPGLNPCVFMADSTLRKTCFLTIPADLHSLTRGHDDMIQLIERLYSSTTNSLTDEDKKRLNPHLTHCVSIQSPKSSKIVVEGLVVPCSSYAMDNLRTKFGCQLNALLINGDLTPAHRHKGYKPVIGKKNIIKRPSDIASQTKEVLWASRIVENMKKLDVSAVFIRGNTSSVMSDVCLSAGIVPLTNISYHALRIISQETETDMLCYAEDASKLNVCKLSLEPMNPSWMDVMEENHCLLVSNLNHVKSVILSEPCALAAQMSEEKFWKGFHRVSNAICDGRVLPGGGVTEIWCEEQIKQKISSLIDFRDSDEQLLKLTILEMIADVFHDFADTIKHNTGTGQEDEQSHLIPHSYTSTCKGDSDSTNHFISTVHNDALKSTSLEREIQDNPQISNIEATRSQGCFKSTLQTFDEPNNCCRNSDVHFDPFCSKISAWQSAVDVVSIVNSLDCLITTGASDNDLDYGGILL